MGVTPEDHLLSFFDGNTGVDRPSFKKSRGRSFSLKKGFNVLDSLLEKEIFIVVLEEKEGFSPPDQRERRRDWNVPKHFGLKIKESPFFVNTGSGTENHWAIRILGPFFLGLRTQHSELRTSFHAFDKG